MKQYFSVLGKSPLFENVDLQQLPEVLDCLGAARYHFDKGEMIFHVGQPAEQVGIVCYGGVHVFTQDFMGNRTILAAVGEGDLFGEAFACAGTSRLPVSVVAAVDSDIILIGFRRLIATAACPFHSQLVENMLGIVAEKNVTLSQRLEIISKRTTREKITAYLSAQAVRAGSRSFTIPFDRQGLADFLCVERSAMSAELSKMQKEGLLETSRSSFTLWGDI